MPPPVVIAQTSNTSALVIAIHATKIQPGIAGKRWRATVHRRTLRLEDRGARSGPARHTRFANSPTDSTRGEHCPRSNAGAAGSADTFTTLSLGTCRMVTGPAELGGAGELPSGQHSPSGRVRPGRGSGWVFARGSARKRVLTMVSEAKPRHQTSFGHCNPGPGPGPDPRRAPPGGRGPETQDRAGRAGDAANCAYSLITDRLTPTRARPHPAPLTWPPTLPTLPTLHAARPIRSRPMPNPKRWPARSFARPTSFLGNCQCLGHPGINDAEVLGTLHHT